MKTRTLGTSRDNDLVLGGDVQGHAGAVLELQDDGRLWLSAEDGLRIGRNGEWRSARRVSMRLSTPRPYQMTL